MENRFNLVDEEWIPVAGAGRASLTQIFSNPELTALGGNAVQKLAVLKLLLAISLSAYTPKDDRDWESLEAKGLGEKCLAYLEEKRELFWLYGEKPFLQMPKLNDLKDGTGKLLKGVPIGRNYIPDLPSENDTILFQSQLSRTLTDAEKAVFIVSIMNYGLGGKRVVKKIPPLSSHYKEKSNSAKSSPSLGNYVGYLNSCIWGQSILETVWLNLFTFQQISQFPLWKETPNIPPWEEMPAGEDDSVARRLKNSFMGTLISMSRFALLANEGVIYIEGIQYPSHKNGWREPFMTFGDKDKMIWTVTNKKPWRNLTSILAANYASGTSLFSCPQIALLLTRARSKRDVIGIWAGGLKVSRNAGDQSVKQTDDYVESLVFIASKDAGEPWFQSFSFEMQKLEDLAKKSLGYAVKNYYASLSAKPERIMEKAKEYFWQMCEPTVQELIAVCDQPENMYILRKQYADFVLQSFNRFCPNQTARQMTAWAKNRPYVRGYLVKEKKEDASA